MAGGTQLRDLVRHLRAETRRSLNEGTGQQERDALVLLLRRVQEWLWTDHEWPGQIVERDITLIPGDRLYSYPADLDFEAINDVWARTGTVWARMGYGITPDEYSLYDPESGVTAWPPLRWQHRVDENQLEVWPTPSEAGPIRIRGRRRLPAMVDDDDVCTLDANLIVLFAAAELLASQKNESAPAKLSAAQRLYVSIKRRQGANKRQPIIIGGGATPRRPARPGFDYIPPGYGSGS